MTAVNQNFTSYAGDDAAPVFTLRDGAGAPIDVSTANEIKWCAARDWNSLPVLTKLKSANQISVEGSPPANIAVAILAADTRPLAGYYVHWVIVTDSGGLISTVALGRWQVGPKPNWSYSGDPATGARDEVRFLIGDTDAASPLVMDPEIDALLVTYPNPYLAAAQAARTIGGKYTRKVSKRVGDLSINWGDLAKQFYTLADELAAQGNTMGLSPYSGGISRADRRAVRDNEDRMRPPFREKQFDNPSGVNNTSEFDFSMDPDL